MSNQGPTPLEGGPQIAGREIPNPDNNLQNRITPTPSGADPVERTDELPGMEEKLKYVPEELHERVRKLTRSDIVTPGAPVDPAAYNAYILAEKIIRQKESSRRKATREGNWNVPTTEG